MRHISCMSAQFCASITWHTVYMETNTGTGPNYQPSHLQRTFCVCRLRQPNKKIPQGVGTTWEVEQWDVGAMRALLLPLLSYRHPVRYIFVYNAPIMCRIITEFCGRRCPAILQHDWLYLIATLSSRLGQFQEIKEWTVLLNSDKFGKHFILFCAVLWALVFSVAYKPQNHYTV
jgi:hypothetical protein